MVIVSRSSVIGIIGLQKSLVVFSKPQGPIAEMMLKNLITRIKKYLTTGTDQGQ